MIIASVDFSDPQVLELVNSELPVVTIDHIFNTAPRVPVPERGVLKLHRFTQIFG